MCEGQMKISELQNRIAGKTRILRELGENANTHPGRNLEQERSEVEQLERQLQIVTDNNKKFRETLLALLWQIIKERLLSLSLPSSVDVDQLTRDINVTSTIKTRGQLIIGGAAALIPANANNQRFYNDIQIILNAADALERSVAVDDPVASVAAVVGSIGDQTLKRVVGTLCRRTQRKEKTLDPDLSRQTDIIRKTKTLHFEAIPGYWNFTEEAKSHYERLWLQAERKQVVVAQPVNASEGVNDETPNSSAQFDQSTQSVGSIRNTIVDNADAQKCLGIMLNEFSERFGLSPTAKYSRQNFLKEVASKAPRRSWSDWFSGWFSRKRKPDEYITLVNLLNAAEQIDSNRQIDKAKFRQRLDRVEAMLIAKSNIIKDKEAAAKAVEEQHAADEQHPKPSAGVFTRFFRGTPASAKQAVAVDAEKIRRDLIYDSISKIADSVEIKHPSTAVSTRLETAGERSNEERAFSAKLTAREKVLDTYANLQDILPGALELPADLDDVNALVYFIFQQNSGQENFPIEWTMEKKLAMKAGGGNFSTLLAADKLNPALFDQSPSLYFAILMISIALTNASADEYAALQSVLSTIIERSFDGNDISLGQVVGQLPARFRWLSGYIPQTIVASNVQGDVLSQVKTALLGNEQQAGMFPAMVVAREVVAAPVLKAKQFNVDEVESLNKQDLKELAINFGQRIVGNSRNLNAKEKDDLNRFFEGEFKDEFKPALSNKAILLRVLLRWYQQNNKAGKDRSAEDFGERCLAEYEKIKVDADETLLIELTNRITVPKNGGAENFRSDRNDYSINLYRKGTVGYRRTSADRLVDIVYDLLPSNRELKLKREVVFTPEEERYISSVGQRAKAIKDQPSIEYLIRDNLNRYRNANRKILAALTLCQWYKLTPGGKKNFETNKSKNKAFIAQYEIMEQRLFSALMNKGEAFPQDKITAFVKDISTKFNKLLFSGVTSSTDSSLSKLFSYLKDIPNYPQPSIEVGARDRVYSASAPVGIHPDDFVEYHSDDKKTKAVVIPRSASNTALGGEVVAVKHVSHFQPAITFRAGATQPAPAWDFNLVIPIATNYVQKIAAPGFDGKGAADQVINKTLQELQSPGNDEVLQKIYALYCVIEVYLNRYRSQHNADSDDIKTMDVLDLKNKLYGFICGRTQEVNLNLNAARDDSPITVLNKVCNDVFPGLIVKSSDLQQPIHQNRNRCK